MKLFVTLFDLFFRFASHNVGFPRGKNLELHPGSKVNRHGGKEFRLVACSFIAMSEADNVYSCAEIMRRRHRIHANGSSRPKLVDAMFLH